MNKQIEIIPSATMSALVNWEWPGQCTRAREPDGALGNPREGRVLNTPLAELRTGVEGLDSDGTLGSLERQYFGFNRGRTGCRVTAECRGSLMRGGNPSVVFLREMPSFKFWIGGWCASFPA